MASLMNYERPGNVMRINIQKALKICRRKIHGPGGAAELLNVVPNTPITDSLPRGQNNNPIQNDI